MSIIVYFRRLGKSKDKFPTTVYIKYFATLSEALEIFNEQTLRSVEKLYNEFGQVIPLTYNVQKTNLEVYYMDDAE